MKQFKDEKIENHAYSVIGMFSTVCEFRSSHWNNQLYPDRVMFRYRLLSEFRKVDASEDYKMIYFTPDGVFRFSNENEVEEFLQQDQEEQNKLNYTSAVDVLTEEGNTYLFKNVQDSTTFVNNWIFLLRCCRPLNI
ncbi:uncharacterized protein LOC129228617 [Uloborus diversus]|uniref:uncharacterized protein LOC129228617 n=1 Tax=Uloborus diversus TaxID=327109 RepID=UPI00240A3144|nr:uncharacterized protein LOC129228617 [Uloborus diversus]